MPGQVSKILVVEDEATVLANIIELLAAEGYLVTGARDGEDAFGYLQTERPDLILCDVRMPRLNGLGLLARISQEPSLANIPFIFLTALKERSDLRAAMELGADDYITKPFSRREILDAIRRRLEKHEVIRSDARHAAKLWNDNLIKILPLEIIQPLALIKSQSALLVNPREKLDLEILEQIGRKIQQAAERLSRLAANYILFTRINSSSIEHEDLLSHPQALDAKKVIEEIAQSTAWQIQRSDDLILQLAEGWVAIDEGSFQCIVEEILTSAFDRTSPGSPVSFVTNIDQNNYQISVADQGHPFSDAQVNWMGLSDIPRVDDFVSLKIGLILAGKLAAIHGGSMVIQSMPDQGNRVNVILPLSQPARIRSRNV